MTPNQLIKSSSFIVIQVNHRKFQRDRFGGKYVDKECWVYKGKYSTYLEAKKYCDSNCIIILGWQLYLSIFNTNKQKITYGINFKKRKSRVKVRPFNLR